MTIVCPNCDHENPRGLDKYEDCGEYLPAESGDTLLLKRDSAGAPVKKKAWKSAEVGESREIAMHVGDAVRPIRLPKDSKLTLGRRDAGSDQKLDVDVGSHNAIELGVSRVHARLRLQDNLVQVQDADSTNGTFLNEQKVSASEWRIVRNGDEIPLGKLVVKVYFETERLF